MTAVRWLCAPRPARHVHRLAVERLEDRSTPAIFTVTSPGGDGGTGSLAWAIAVANANPGLDTVQFDQSPGGAFGGFAVPQTINLATGLLHITDDLTIQGPGRDLLSISGQNVRGGFDVLGGLQVGLSGLTIANTLGGLNLEYNYALNSSITLTVTDCAFRNNSRFSGGAIRNFVGNLTLTNTIFDHNSAGFSGGAIDMTAGTLTLKDCRFTDNSAGSGGAVSVNGPATVTGTTFSGNTATAHGGAISNMHWDGGFGMWVSRGTDLRVNDSTFHGNSTPGDGGGIYLSRTSEAVTAALDATRMTANFANRGGAIANINASLVMTNCTLAGNTGFTDGGGMFIDPSVVTIISSTITENTAPVGADLSTLESTVTLVGSTVGVIAASGGSVTVTNLFSYQAAAIDQLEAQVAALDLSSGQRNSLQSSLDAARQSLAAGNGTAAVGQLGAFVNKVTALVHSQRLGEISADALIGQVDSLVDTI